MSYSGDESFQAITCTGTYNSKQTKENAPKNTKQKNPQNEKAVIARKSTGQKPLMVQNQKQTNFWF